MQEFTSSRNNTRDDKGETLDKELFVWVQDHSWRGCVVVIAETEEAAREMMEHCYNYVVDESLESFPIKAGFVFECLGDT